MSRVVIYKQEFDTNGKGGTFGPRTNDMYVIDPNTEGLVPENIKLGEEVLGVTGTYQPADENLKPENIKKGITIFGVTGTYEA